MDDKLVVQSLMLLIALVIGLIGFIWNGHVRQHDKINQVLEDLAHTKKTCMGIFALQKDLIEVGGRVALLEQKRTDSKNDK